MRDVEVQVRHYARFALDGVQPVSAAEAAARRPVAYRAVSSFPHARIAALVVAAVAVVAGGVLWPERTDPPVQVSVQPPPSSAPTQPATSDTTTASPPAPTGGPWTGAPLRFPGMPGARRHGGGETSIKAVTLSGESFWVTVPDDIPEVAAFEVVPSAVFDVSGSVGSPSWLTTLSGRQVMERRCWPPGSEPPCANITVRTQRRSERGASVTVWGPGAVEPVVTVEMDTWTLVLDTGDLAAMERTADALAWSVDGEGYLRLHSEDPGVAIRYLQVDLAPVATGDPVEGPRISVMPGCDARPELGWGAVGPALHLMPIHSNRVQSAAAGVWCVASRYRVDVVAGDAAVVTRLYDRVRIEK